MGGETTQRWRREEELEKRGSKCQDKCIWGGDLISIYHGLLLEQMGAPSCLYGSQLAEWLGNRATNQKVAGSIPDFAK